MHSMSFTRQATIFLIECCVHFCADGIVMIYFCNGDISSFWSLSSPSITTVGWKKSSSKLFVWFVLGASGEFRT